MQSHRHDAVLVIARICVGNTAARDAIGFIKPGTEVDQLATFAAERFPALGG
jgi:hypothetical protein